MPTTARSVLPLAAALACLAAAPPAAAQSEDFQLVITDRLVHEVLDNGFFVADADASHSIDFIAADRSYLRNGAHTVNLLYRIGAQASADSTLFSGADSARVSGAVDLGFTLPGGALWNMRVDTVWQGVLASNATSASASGAPLVISGGGVAAGLASTTPLPSFFNPVVNNSRGARTEASTNTLRSRLPGSGVVTAGLQLFAQSDGGEALAAIGHASGLSSFSLNGQVLASDGAFVTVRLTPHLDLAGETLLGGAFGLQTNERISGFGTIANGVEGFALVRPSGGTLTLGGGPGPSHVHLLGLQEVGAATLVLRDDDAAELDGFTTMAGGSIVAPNRFGVRLEGDLRGHGSVIGPIGGSAGGRITAQGGNLVLGDATAFNAWTYAGTLDVNGRSVTVHDPNQAQLLGPTLLRGGTLHAPNGLVLTSTISGGGLVDAALVNDGLVNPMGGTVTLAGPVSGGGDYGAGTVVLADRFAPGHSPAVVAFAGNMTLTAASLLEIELGGLLRGSQYDALDVMGAAQLAGALEVDLIDGFGLGFGQSFEIIDAGTLFGTFAGLAEGGRVGSYGGLELFITYAGGDGNDVFLFTPAAIPEPQTYLLMLAGLALVGFAARRRTRPPRISTK